MRAARMARMARAPPRCALVPHAAQPRRQAAAAPPAPAPAPAPPPLALPRRAALAALVAAPAALLAHADAARAATMFGPRAVQAAKGAQPAPTLSTGPLEARDVSPVAALAALLDGREALQDAAAIRGAEGGKRVRLRRAALARARVSRPCAAADAPRRRNRLPALSAAVQNMSAFLPAAVALADSAAAAAAPGAEAADAAAAPPPPQGASDSDARLDTVGTLLVGASTVVTMDRIGRERAFEDAEIPQVARSLARALLALPRVRALPCV
jgi:hypothetical protein